MTPQADVPLSALSTMGVGGPARWLTDARSESDVIAALQWAAAHDAAVHVLGGGSNVVFADGGFDGLVVHVNIRGVDEPTGSGGAFSVGAGEPWDRFVALTVNRGYAGVECLSGIPGYVGGTPVQNVGAYGQDVSETITRVHTIDRHSLESCVVSNAECRFGYRSSRFKADDINRFVVTRVEFALTRDGAPSIRYADLVAYFRDAGRADPTLSEVREATLAVRRRKGMVIESTNIVRQSCGSFFVNPVVSTTDVARVSAIAGAEVPHFAVSDQWRKIPAAWLIERAGFPKGTTRGPVGISPFQAQAIFNAGGATAADVLALACDVKRAVWNTFGISIVPEPVFVGFAPSSELRFLLTQQRSH
jgi:UDP-N-acetylmuramate dehydrogenase